jgi:uncharacterized membrane-anchored protein
MKYMYNGLLLAGLVLVLAAINLDILKKQAIVDDGQPLLLQLRPVDPRSLIQGDYMELRYDQSAFPVGEVAKGLPRAGSVILTVDEDNVGRFNRIDDGTPLSAGEVRLRFKLRLYDGELRYGAESFFFQEGQAERYEAARYGVLHLDESGASVLVGLADADGNLLGRD